MLPDDFVNEWFCPSIYDGVEVDAFLGDTVRLRFVDEDGGSEDEVSVSRDEMAQMLGWQDGWEEGRDGSIRAVVVDEGDSGSVDTRTETRGRTLFW